MHDHPNYMVVYLTDLQTKMAFPSAPTVDNRRNKGDVAFREAYTHQTENVEDTPAEEIQTRLK